MDIETGHGNGHSAKHIVPSASTGSLSNMGYAKSLSKAFLSAGMVVSIKARHCRLWASMQGLPPPLVVPSLPAAALLPVLRG